jgi:hypothetical protein
MAVLVESYTSSPLSRSAADGLINDALKASPSSEVQYLGSMYIPGDSTAFFLFGGDSFEAVRDVMERAGIAVDRLVAADARGGLDWPKEG